MAEAQGPDWERIKAEYLAGGVSCRELAEKYQISQNRIQKRSSKEGWKKARQKVGEKVAEKTITRVARARARAAEKALDVTSYTTDLWNDNLKSLNELIRNTPEYMLSNPTFASGIAKGLATTWDLLLRISGQSDADRKLKMEQEKLKLEKARFELEKRKFEAEQAKRAADTGMRMTWQIVEDSDGADDISG